MTVAFIMARKGREVVTATPDQSLQDIAVLLSTRGIGAVVISRGQGDVQGILSERDIVRAIGTKGLSALSEPASAYMTAKVMTTDDDASIDDVMEQMTMGRFRHMPVLRDGHLDGVVSIGDVVKTRLERIEVEHQAMRNYIATA